MSDVHILSLMDQMDAYLFDNSDIVLQIVENGVDKNSVEKYNEVMRALSIFYICNTIRREDM